MSAELSERIGQLVIPATVQCTTPETTDDDPRTLTVYGAWTPDEQLQYTGTTMQSLYMRERQHRSDAWRDETCCPLYRHAATLPNRLDDWSFRPILQCQIDMVRCHAARGKVENHVIEALRGAGYNLYNKSLAYDTGTERGVHGRRLVMNNMRGIKEIHHATQAGPRSTKVWTNKESARAAKDRPSRFYRQAVRKALGEGLAQASVDD